MKTMVLLFGLFGFSLGAFASNNYVPVERVTHEVNATIGVWVGHSGKIYYDCEEAETQIIDFLQQLGATNIDLRCTGGLDHNGFTTLARITGQFDSYVAASGSENLRPFDEVNLRGRDNCALIAELFHIFKDKFVIEDLTGRGSRVSATCRTNRSYNVDLKVIR